MHKREDLSSLVYADEEAAGKEDTWVWAGDWSCSRSGRAKGSDSFQWLVLKAAFVKVTLDLW